MDENESLQTEEIEVNDAAQTIEINIEAPESEPEITPEPEAPVVVVVEDHSEWQANQEADAAQVVSEAVTDLVLAQQVSDLANRLTALESQILLSNNPNPMPEAESPALESSNPPMQVEVDAVQVEDSPASKPTPRSKSLFQRLIF